MQQEKSLDKSMEDYPVINLREDKGLADDVLIILPNKVTASHKLLALGLTLFFWGAMLWLWSPLITLGLSFFEIPFFYNQLLMMREEPQLLEATWYYLLLIVPMVATLLLWAKFNQYTARRKAQAPLAIGLTVENMAEHYAQDVVKVRQWQEHTQMVVDVAANGRIEGVHTASLLNYREAKKLAESLSVSVESVLVTQQDSEKTREHTAVHSASVEGDVRVHE